MRRVWAFRPLRSWLAAVLLLAGAVAVAQDAPPADGDGANGAPAESSDKDKLDDANKSIGAMQGKLGDVNKLADQAKAEKDPIRLTCVSGDKTQIQALIKTAELALADLKDGMERRESEAVSSEYNKIKLAKGKVDQYATEAAQCIGSLAFYDSEKTEIQVTQTPGMPNVDGITPDPVPLPTFRPPPASPLR